MPAVLARAETFPGNESLSQAEIACCIGISAIAPDIFNAGGLAGKPFLLMPQQLAYVAAGLAGAIIIDDDFSTG